MKRQTWSLIGMAVALAALAALTATPAQAHLPLLRRGTSDFARLQDPTPPTTSVPLRRGQSDFGPISPTTTSARAHLRPEELRRGASDFGHSFGQTHPTSVPTHPRNTPSSGNGRAEGFQWTDAGVGAAAMLGIVLVVGGLGAAFLLAHPPTWIARRSAT